MNETLEQATTRIGVCIHCEQLMESPLQPGAGSRTYRNADEYRQAHESADCVFEDRSWDV